MVHFASIRAMYPEFTAGNLGQFDVHALDGLQAWFSVRGTMKDGRFYQCAMVNFRRTGSIVCGC